MDPCSTRNQTTSCRPKSDSRRAPPTTEEVRMIGCTVSSCVASNRSRRAMVYLLWAFEMLKIHVIRLLKPLHWHPAKAAMWLHGKGDVEAYRFGCAGWWSSYHGKGMGCVCRVPSIVPKGSVFDTGCSAKVSQAGLYDQASQQNDQWPVLLGSQARHSRFRTSGDLPGRGDVIRGVCGWFGRGARS